MTLEPIKHRGNVSGGALLCVTESDGVRRNVDIMEPLKRNTLSSAPLFHRRAPKSVVAIARFRVTTPDFIKEADSEKGKLCSDLC